MQGGAARAGEAVPGGRRHYFACITLVRSALSWSNVTATAWGSRVACGFLRNPFNNRRLSDGEGGAARYNCSVQSYVVKRRFARATTGYEYLRATRRHTVGCIGVCDQEQGVVECLCRAGQRALSKLFPGVHNLKGLTTFTLQMKRPRPESGPDFVIPCQS